MDDQELVSFIKRSKSKTLEECLRLLESMFPDSASTLTERVLVLLNEGKISFDDKSNRSNSFREYLFSKRIKWFWIVLIFSTISFFMVFLIPENSYPILFFRNVFGAFLVLFLPGYVMIKALFGIKELDTIERFALSLGLSLVLVPLVAFLLNYTAWGLKTIPVAFFLFVLILLFGIAGVIRQYWDET